MTDATIRPEDIRWRVGQVSKKDAHKGSLLGYIDARTCMEALDALDPEWSSVHGDPIIVGDVLMGVPCTVTVNGVRRSDVGMPSSQEPIKGAYSDALKRAAVHFGIGRELYELPRIWVTLDDYKRPVATPTFRNGRWTLPNGTGTVFYDREPDAPEQRGGKRPSSPSAAPAPTRYRRGELVDLMATHNLDNDAVDAIANRIGIPVKERPMSDASMDQLIAAIEQPAGVPSSPVGEAGGHPASPEPTIDDVLAVTGGELVEAETHPAEEAIAYAARTRKSEGRTIEEAIADAESRAKKVPA